MSMRQVHTQLIQAEASYEKWSFAAESTPNGQALYDHLFRDEPIEWNRACRGATDPQTRADAAARAP